jgi:Zn-finger protein
MSEFYKFVQNRDCEFFPCHDQVEESEFNCLFCYCPLYGLKDQCGGNYVYLENGIKDCSHCKVPHIKNKGYNFIMKKVNDVIELGKKNETE